MTHDTAVGEGHELAEAAPGDDHRSFPMNRMIARWLPLAAVLVTAFATLSMADTPVLSVLRYGFYAVYGVVIPGTLVFRACRSTPHTLVEDLAYGAAVGLALEIVAWAALSAAGLQGLAVLWPLTVIIPFIAVPALRRHLRPRGYVQVSLAWSWSVALLVCAALWYLYGAFFIENSILPTSEHSSQFLDLSYQLSLAGNAKHQFPLTLPQAAGEPLNYHWFAFVHMAMTSLVGGIDLPVVEMRLMMPGLTALMLVLTSVTGWRLTGRAWAGPVAAALFFAIGEFTFDYPMAMPFGSPETALMVWASFSMTYSQPLLMALISAVGDLLKPAQRLEPRPFGKGAFVLVGLFAFGSSAAKASSLPVTLAALGLVGLVGLIRTRRVPWTVVGLGAVVVVWQLFSTAVIFKFHSYGLKIDILANLKPYWASSSRGTSMKILLAAATAVAFLLYTQLRVAGLIPLLALRRFRLSDREWFLLGGAVAGPAIMMCLSSGWAAAYFTHAGLAFGVFLSAAGFVEVYERAAMTRRANAILAIASSIGVTGLTIVIYRYSERINAHVMAAFRDAGNYKSYSALLPILAFGSALAALAAIGAVFWRICRRWIRGLGGRGGVALLTGVLLAGTPTLILDVVRASHLGYFGQYATPVSRIQAARWIRAHSTPDDVIATNVHCWSADDYAQPHEACTDPNSFWLSAYTERSVLVEGWSFAPRVMAQGTSDFWNPALLALNDRAIYHPTAAELAELATVHHVRYLVVDRKLAPEGPALPTLAKRVYDNGRIAVYALS